MTNLILIILVIANLLRTSIFANNKILLSALNSKNIIAEFNFINWIRRIDRTNYFLLLLHHGNKGIKIYRHQLNRVSWIF